MIKLTGQHQPFTLLGGGLFHLAFGAILTGSAFASKDWLKQRLNMKIKMLILLVILSSCAKPVEFVCEWEIPYVCSWGNK